MLIPSRRHTAADLRLWREMEAGDLAHGRSASLARKVDRSLAEIRDFAAAGPCAAGVSWGKDSVVLADLVGRAGLSVPLFWVRWPGTDNPDSAAVRAAFAAERPAADLREVIAPADDADDGRAGFAMAAAAFGDRRLSGVRADESAARRLSAAKHGHATERACRPLLRWTAADVFGYLEVVGLPVHPAYAMLGGGRWPRDRLRVDSLGGTRGQGHGRARWEAEYYGDVLNRMAAGRPPASPEPAASTAACATRSRTGG